MPPNPHTQYDLNNPLLADPESSAVSETDYGTFLSRTAPVKRVSSERSEDVSVDSMLEQHHNGFGEKRISFWGSCVLNFNNITGPAVVVLPLLFQQAGWFLPTLGLLTMWLLSSLSATMLCESMQRIPGNRAFTKRFEYCTLVRHYFGERAFYLAQIGFNAGLIASNIAAMIVTTQVIDTMANRFLGSTYGLDFSTWPFEILKSSDFETNGCYWGEDSPGVCNISVISLGFLLSMLICLPLGWLNLEDNISFQWLSMVAQFAFSFEFAYQFLLNMTPGTEYYCEENGPKRTPMLGLDMTQVLGICVFSYSYVSTIPSWVNEKKPKVSVKTAIWLPASLGTALNIMLGLLGAWAYRLLDEKSHQPLEGTDNMLNLLTGHADPSVTCKKVPISTITQLSVDLWGFLGYIPGIPILSIIVRYNLLAGEVFGEAGSFFWGVVAPWLVTAFCYQAEVLVAFCNWVAIICQGFINLVVPCLLYIEALRRYPLKQEVVGGPTEGRREGHLSEEVDGEEEGEVSSYSSHLLSSSGIRREGQTPHKLIISEPKSSPYISSLSRPEPLSARNKAASQGYITHTGGETRGDVYHVLRKESDKQERLSQALERHEPPVNALPGWLGYLFCPVIAEEGGGRIAKMALAWFMASLLTVAVVASIISSIVFNN